MPIVVKLNDSQLDELAERVAEKLAARTPGAWMDATDTARYLNVSRRAVYDYVRRAGLPCHRDDGDRSKMWFRRDEVDRWRSPSA
jgi:excisionase family DNA binding protein